MVLGRYPVQCLAVPRVYQGPNLPFQWFLPFFVEVMLQPSWTTGSSERPGIATRWLQVPLSSLKIHLQLLSLPFPHPDPLPSKSFFWRSSSRTNCSFSLREKKCVTEAGNLYLVVDLARIWNEEQLIPIFFHIVSLVWQSVPIFIFKRSVFPRALSTFLLAENLCLQPGIRMTCICFTIPLDHSSLRTRTGKLIPALHQRYSDEERGIQWLSWMDECISVFIFKKEVCLEPGLNWINLRHYDIS